MKQGSDHHQALTGDALKIILIQRPYQEVPLTTTQVKNPWTGRTRLFLPLEMVGAPCAYKDWGTARERGDSTITASEHMAPRHRHMGQSLHLHLPSIPSHLARMHGPIRHCSIPLLLLSMIIG